MSIRTDKVSSVVQRILGEEILKLELPFLTTISKVEVTPDLKHGKVWITVMPAGEENEQRILNILAKNLYDLQGQINRQLQMKMIPRIKFTIDHSEEYSAHINELIRHTHGDEQE